MSNPFKPSKNPPPLVELPSPETGRNKQKEQKLVEKTLTRQNPKTEKLEKYKVITRTGTNLEPGTSRSTFR